MWVGLMTASLARFKEGPIEYFPLHKAYDFIMSFPMLSIWEVGFIISI